MITYASRLAARAEELAALQPGWLDGCGERIDRADLGLALRIAHLATARELGPASLFPRESGGCALEWHWGEGARGTVTVDLEITGGQIECLVMDHRMPRDDPRAACWYEHTADSLELLLDELGQHFWEAG